MQGILLLSFLSLNYLARPIDGYTRVTIYSSGFAGMNHETYPTPMCRFKGADAIEASWIHCVGLDTSPNATRVTIHHFLLNFKYFSSLKSVSIVSHLLTQRLKTSLSKSP